MRSSKWSAVLFVLAVFHSAAAAAASIDMEDPRRALGREDDVRVDAQLTRDSVSPGSTIGVTYQIENLGRIPVAVADKVTDISYDADTATITLGLGSEVPPDGVMPRMAVIAPGEKKTFTGGAVLRIAAPRVRSAFTVVPRLVRIKVTVLRELAAFASLLQRQAASTAPITLSDSQFEKWLESSDTIYLNSIPVRYDPSSRSNGAEADPDAGGGYR